jgi:uncharacterized membrane protein YdbT with pleckstrin-like domain
MKFFSLKDREELICTVRRYPLTYVVKAFVIAALFGATFFFMFWFFKQGERGVRLFVLLLATDFLFLLQAFVVHYRNVTYITTHRVVDINRYGFFRCTVSDIPYDQIEDVSGHINGLLGMLFRCGDVHIQTAGGTVRVVIDRVFQPTHIQQRINGMRETYLGHRHSGGSFEN